MCTACDEIYYGPIVSLGFAQYPVLTILGAWYPAAIHHHYSPISDIYYLSAGLVAWALDVSTNTQHLSSVLHLPTDSKNELSYIPVVMSPSFSRLPSYKGWTVKSLDRLWAFSCSDSVYLSHHIFSLFSTYKFCFFNLELPLQNGVEEQIILTF